MGKLTNIEDMKKDVIDIKLNSKAKSTIKKLIKNKEHPDTKIVHFTLDLLEELKKAPQAIKLFKDHNLWIDTKSNILVISNNKTPELLSIVLNSCNTSLPVPTKNTIIQKSIEKETQKRLNKALKTFLNHELDRESFAHNILVFLFGLLKSRNIPLHEISQRFTYINFEMGTGQDKADRETVAYCIYENGIMMRIELSL